ncbi:tetratricopeptide repeat protein, partial [Acaryochloris marina NIES-2412]|uniref:tetratricopeptide repeat protein n=1 Tax=Acaryochloris marina TaxID=155978 RepID=UPI00405803B5
RGWVYHQLEQYPKALEDHNKAISLDPELAQAYANRGVTNYYLEKESEAKQDLQIAANLFEQQGNQASHQDMLDALNEINTSE